MGSGGQTAENSPAKPSFYTYFPPLCAKKVGLRWESNFTIIRPNYARLAAKLSGSPPNLSPRPKATQAPVRFIVRDIHLQAEAPGPLLGPYTIAYTLYTPTYPAPGL